MRKHSWRWQIPSLLNPQYIWGPGYSIHKCEKCGIGKIELKRPGTYPKVKYFKNKKYFPRRPECGW